MLEQQQYEIHITEFIHHMIHQIIVLLYFIYHIIDIFIFQNTLFSAAGEAFSPVGCGGLYQGKPPE